MKFTKQNLNKVKQSWWNFQSKVENVVDIVKTHPKKIAAAVIISASSIYGTGWLVYNHTVPFKNCVMKAWYEQKIDWDMYEYRIFTNACMVNRGTHEKPKWIQVNKVMDVSTTPTEGDVDGDVDMDGTDLGE